MKSLYASDKIGNFFQGFSRIIARSGAGSGQGRCRKNLAGRARSGREKCRNLTGRVGPGGFRNLTGLNRPAREDVTQSANSPGNFDPFIGSLSFVFARSQCMGTVLYMQIGLCFKLLIAGLFAWHDPIRGSGRVRKNSKYHGSSPVGSSGGA